MRNMAVLHSPAFSYPLPVLVRVLFNLLIFKGKILYYNKYSNKSRFICQWYMKNQAPSYLKRYEESVNELQNKYSMNF